MPLIKACSSARLSLTAKPSSHCGSSNGQDAPHVSGDVWSGSSTGYCSVDFDWNAVCLPHNIAHVEAPRLPVPVGDVALSRAWPAERLDLVRVGVANTSFVCRSGWTWHGSLRVKNKQIEAFESGCAAVTRVGGTLRLHQGCEEEHSLCSLSLAQHRFFFECTLVDARGGIAREEELELCASSCEHEKCESATVSTAVEGFHRAGRVRIADLAALAE